MFWKHATSTGCSALKLVRRCKAALINIHAARKASIHICPAYWMGFTYPVLHHNVQIVKPQRANRWWTSFADIFLATFACCSALVQSKGALCDKECDAAGMSLWQTTQLNKHSATEYSIPQLAGVPVDISNSCFERSKAAQPTVPSDTTCTLLPTALVPGDNLSPGTYLCVINNRSGGTRREKRSSRTSIRLCSTLLALPHDLSGHAPPCRLYVPLLPTPSATRSSSTIPRR